MTKSRSFKQDVRLYSRIRNLPYAEARKQLTAERIAEEKWAEENITNNSLPALPPYPEKDTPWNIFPLGETKNGSINLDILKHPHTLIFGETGTGTLSLTQNIVTHALKHNDDWNVILVRARPTKFEGNSSNLHIITNSESLTDEMESLETLMRDRYDFLKDNNLSILPHEEHRSQLLILHNPIYFFTDTEEDQKKYEKCQQLLTSILRLGRAVGIHIILITQKPDARTLSGEQKQNFNTRIVFRGDVTAGSMVLDSPYAMYAPTLPVGRGIIKRYGERLQVFQTYYHTDEK